MSSTLSSGSSAELLTLFGAVSDAVLTSDSCGNVEFLNPAAERLTGQTQATAVGRPVGEILPLASESDNTPLESPTETCRRSGASIGPFVARLVDTGAGRRVLEVSAAPMWEQKAITGVITLARDVTRARQISQRLSHEATHDALTGLVNRTEFVRRLARARLSAVQGAARHALAFLDLDGFKQINDRCGHRAGDQLLQQLSSRIRKIVRTRDTVARLGGDEFGILLEHCSTAEAVRIANEVRKAISDHEFACQGACHHVGASIGIVPLEGGSALPDQLLQAADSACYQAKRAGGNRVQLQGVAARSLPGED